MANDTDSAPRSTEAERLRNAERIKAALSEQRGTDEENEDHRDQRRAARAARFQEKKA